MLLGVREEGFGNFSLILHYRWSQQLNLMSTTKMVGQNCLRSGLGIPNVQKGIDKIEKYIFNSRTSSIKKTIMQTDRVNFPLSKHNEQKMWRDIDLRMLPLFFRTPKSFHNSAWLFNFVFTIGLSDKSVPNSISVVGFCSL